jgi:large subunit ribosomal protein L24
MNRIKTGDEVIVITGKNKGRRGRVLTINADSNRIVVEGVNMIKKHQKANPQAGKAGGIIEKEAAIHVSNVMLFNPETGKGDRVGYKNLDDGRKVRYFKSNNEVVDA